MTDEDQSTHTPEQKPLPFGARLKSVRETMGLDRKDAAAQLRLNEKVIIMMEKDKYPADLPVTFIRGYLRAYGRLLDIPEHEIKKSLEPIKPKPRLHDAASIPTLQPLVTSKSYFMQFFTSIIVLTILALMGMWWYSNDGTNSSMTTVNATNPTINLPNKNTTQPIENKVPLATTPKAAKSNSPSQNADTSDTSDADSETADTTDNEVNE